MDEDKNAVPNQMSQGSDDTAISPQPVVVNGSVMQPAPLVGGLNQPSQKRKF